VRDGSVRKANIAMLCLWLVVLFSCAGMMTGCEKSEMCSWSQAFWTGAQIGLPLFGEYQSVAQGVITTGQSLTTMMCQESEANKQAALAMQMMATIRELNALGGKAGIQ